MARKRDKRSRIRGRRTVGWGSRKKHRGSGSRGGFGMAGTGKKAGQRKPYVLKNFPGYLGKKGFTSLQDKNDKEIINLREINLKLDQFKKKGIVKETSEGLTLDLSNYKVLGEGELEQKLIIQAQSFSASAKQKIAAKGGKVIEKQN